MKKTQLIWVFGLLLVGMGLILWSKYNSPDRDQVVVWNSYGVECLPNGHQNLGQHIHPDLFVTIDGEHITIPADVGINRQCMSEVHTHDSTGKIHIESIDPQREFTLEQFFNVWSEPLIKEGYNISMTVNGSTTDSIAGYIMKDFDQIMINYISATSTVSTTSPTQ